MRPTRIRRRALRSVVMVWTGALVLGVADARASSHATLRGETVLIRADSLQRAGASDAAFALLDSMAAIANAKEDAALRISAGLGRARALLGARRLDDAVKLLQTMLPELRAGRDTLAWCRGERYQARAYEVLGRRDEARAGYTRAVDLARVAGLRAEWAWARQSLAGMDFDDGRSETAIAGYRKAIPVFAATRDPTGSMSARAGLARALQESGHADEARPIHLKLLDDATRRGDRVVEAQTSANLGVLELASGDPSVAAPRLERSLALYHLLGWRDRELWAANALGTLYLNMGRYDEADSAFSRALPQALVAQDPEVRARALCQMGVLRRLQGRRGEAVALGRSAITGLDSIRASGIPTLITPLVATLEGAGQTAAAVALLDSVLARVGGRLTPGGRKLLTVRRGQLLRELGRPREAIAALRVAVPDSLTIPGGNDGAAELSVLTDLARCYGDLGRRDSALVWYRRIADLWERWRTTTTDPRWRERYDDFSQRFTGEYAAALLDSTRGLGAEERAREAFDALQRFRARTLTERISAPGNDAPGPLAIADSRAVQTALQSTELLLDVHPSADTTFAFVVTRDHIRAVGLRARATLVPRLARLRDAAADATSSPGGVLSAAGEALGAEWLTIAADLMPGTHRILFSTGPLAIGPLELLVAPGEKEALIVGRECAWIPSPGLFVAARTRHPAAHPHAILAIAPSGSGSEAIPGAERETAWLTHRFVGCDRLPGDDPRPAVTVENRSSGYSVLHIAAHTRSGGRRPWQDAIRVTNRGAETDWLTAAQISHMRVTSRVCVIAGCTSLGDASAWGETMDGLASAWIAAGARTVIATRWAIDDDATSSLMRVFYTGLARGETAGAALRDAQLELSRGTKYAHPYFWAGVMLLGDPDVKVDLRERVATGAPSTHPSR
jgi:tetratricopeptide (TPR) repeat protein